MRTREEISKEYITFDDWEKLEARGRRLILEVLLDIRELLTPPTREEKEV